MCCLFDAKSAILLRGDVMRYFFRAMAITLVMVAVWDAMAFTVMENNGYTKADLLLTHPGGAVGQKLVEEKK